jgi:chemotaxis protein MotB
MTSRTLLVLTIALTAGVLGLTGPALALDPRLQQVAYGENSERFFAGYIAQTLPIEGRISGTPDLKNFLGRNETVYARLEHPEEVKVGDLFTTYRRPRKIFHPQTNTYLGDLIEIVAIVTVEKVDERFATTTVVRAFSPLLPGDPIMRFMSPQEILPPAPIEGRSFPQAPGMIVEIQDPRTLIAQRNVVYLDWGREQGLQVGDRLEVFRNSPGFPERIIGELKALVVDERTATAIITRSLDPLLKADRFRIKTTPTPLEAARMAQELLAHDAIDQMTQTKNTLTRSMQHHISRGTVTVEQQGNEVTIRLAELVEKLEFSSGVAHVTPEGEQILKELSEVLQTVADKRIRIQGHTDNVTIGPTLKRKYPTNMELSKARAKGIFQYFAEEGRLNRQRMTYIGFADAKPVASNRSEDGRRKNRRIEIVLYPDAPSSRSAEDSTPTTALPPTSGGTFSSVPQASEATMDTPGNLEPNPVPDHSGEPRTP